MSSLKPSKDFLFFVCQKLSANKYLKNFVQNIVNPGFFTHLINNIFMTIFIQELITWSIFCIKFIIW